MKISELLESLYEGYHFLPNIKRDENGDRVRDENGRAVLDHTNTLHYSERDTRNHPSLTKHSVNRNAKGSVHSLYVDDRPKNIPEKELKKDLFHPGNPRERDELEGSGVSLANNIPIYYGGHLRKGKGEQPDGMSDEEYKNLESKHMPVMDAIKDRLGRGTTPAAEHQIYKDAIDGVFLQIKHHPAAGLHKKGQKIVLVPIPSSSHIPETFAKKLKTALESKLGSEVTIAGDDTILQPNLNYSVHANHEGKREDTQYMEKVHIERIYRTNILNQVQNGNRTTAEAIDEVSKNLEYTKRELAKATKAVQRDESEDNVGLWGFQTDHVEVLEDVLEKLHEDERYNNRKTRSPDARPQRHATMAAIHRKKQFFNRMEVNPDYKGGPIDNNTTVLLVDDNVEDAITFGNSYRALIKGGVITDKSKVAGVVMHDLRDLEKVPPYSEHPQVVGQRAYDNAETAAHTKNAAIDDWTKKSKVADEAEIARQNAEADRKENQTFVEPSTVSAKELARRAAADAMARHKAAGGDVTQVAAGETSPPVEPKKTKTKTKPKPKKPKLSPRAQAIKKQEESGKVLNKAGQIAFNKYLVRLSDVVEESRSLLSYILR